MSLDVFAALAQPLSEMAIHNVRLVGVVVLSVLNDTVAPEIPFEIINLRIQFVRKESELVSRCRITNFSTQSAPIFTIRGPLVFSAISDGSQTQH